MKKLIKALLSLSLLAYSFVAVSPVFAAASLSTSATSIYVGQSVTLSVRVNAAAWDVRISASGPVGSGCALHEADASADATNISRTFSVTCTATGTGTITATLAGDTTSADGNESPASGSVSILVMTAPAPEPAPAPTPTPTPAPAPAAQPTENPVSAEPTHTEDPAEESAEDEEEIEKFGDESVSSTIFDPTPKSGSDPNSTNCSPLAGHDSENGTVTDWAPIIIAILEFLIIITLAIWLALIYTGKCGPKTPGNGSKGGNNNGGNGGGSKKVTEKKSTTKPAKAPTKTTTTKSTTFSRFISAPITSIASPTSAASTSTAPAVSSAATFNPVAPNYSTPTNPKSTTSSLASQTISHNSSTNIPGLSAADSEAFAEIGREIEESSKFYSESRALPYNPLTYNPMPTILTHAERQGL